MNVLVAFVVGALASLLLGRLLEPVLESPNLQRRNYRDHDLATAGGIVAVCAVLLGIACATTERWIIGTDRPFLRGSSGALVSVFIGFALLGFVDDLLGDGKDRGFIGHVQALRSGRMTTGVVKLVGGAAIAAIAVDQLDLGTPRKLLGVALVGLAANLANLFDCAPTRTLKVGLVAWSAIAVGSVLSTTVGSASRAVAMIGSLCVGACVGLAPAEARERLMLGDTGANALGAVLGFVVVATSSVATECVVFGLLFACNAASEYVSFSAAIDRIPVLRAIDRAGTHR